MYLEEFLSRGRGKFKTHERTAQRTSIPKNVVQLDQHGHPIKLRIPHVKPKPGESLGHTIMSNIPVQTCSAHAIASSIRLHTGFTRKTSSKQASDDNIR